MCYPAVFPKTSEPAPPAKQLEIEAALAGILASAVPSFFAHHQEDLPEQLLHELRALGIVAWKSPEDAAAGRLIEENRQVVDAIASYRRALPEDAPRLPWLAPDWGRVEALLGPSAAQEWRERLARWEAGGGIEPEAQVA